MIDFHTHILPAMDDGAKHEEMAIALLVREQEQGVQEVVLTPHYYAKKRTPEEFLSARAEAFEKIKERIPVGLKVRLGAEVHLTGVNDPSDEALCSLAIEGTKCVLVEFPFEDEWNENLLPRLQLFAKRTGYTPIVAHVERYTRVLQNPSVLENLAQAGCLLQLNTSAFFMKSTRRFAKALLSKYMVHCIGTDTHDLAKRAPDYVQARWEIFRNGYGLEFRSAQGCMKRLLAGEKVRAIYSRVRKFFVWYF